MAHNTAVSYVNRERRRNAGFVSLEEIEQTAASGEQRLRGVQVGVQAQIEVGLALAADRRGQVEDRIGAG